jgi:hypothetical protein
MQALIIQLSVAIGREHFVTELKSTSPSEAAMTKVRTDQFELELKLTTQLLMNWPGLWDEEQLVFLRRCSAKPVQPEKSSHQVKAVSLRFSKFDLL